MANRSQINKGNRFRCSRCCLQGFLTCCTGPFWSDCLCLFGFCSPSLWCLISALTQAGGGDLSFSFIAFHSISIWPCGFFYGLDYFYFLFFFHFFIIYLFFFVCGGFCHTLKWNSHGFTCVPHPDPPSHLPLHLLPLGFPSAPGPSACLMHPTWAGDLFHPR